jgi:altronate dehydratase
MSRKSTVFAVANVGGIALYAYLILQIVQRIQQEQRSADGIDGIAYFATAFPVLALFVTADLIWVTAMLNQLRKHRDAIAPLLVGLAAIAARAAAASTLTRVA